MSEKGQLRTLVDQLKEGNIDRRSFLQGASALGVATGVSMFLANAAAAGSSRNGFAFYAQATPEATPVGSGPVPPSVGMDGKTRGQDGVLKLLQWQAPTHLMSHRSTGTKDFLAADIINEPLIRYAEDGSLIPNLITEVPSVENGLLAEDLTSATFKLLEGVLWSDGEPLTANDIVFTWQFVVDPNSATITADVWAPIANIEATDDLTAVVTFNQPSAAWFDPFTGGNNGHIYPAHFWGGDHTDSAKSDAFQLAPIGTGPFKLDKFSANDSVQYVVNENYRFANKPAFAQVELKGGGDAPAAATSVLQTGDYDYAWNLQVEPSVIQGMIGDDSPGQYIVKKGTSLERVHFNFSDPNTEVDGQRSEKNTPHPFLSDYAVRDAISSAINREQISAELYGEGQPATSNVLNGLEAFASPNTSFVYDSALANQILEDAGWVMDGNVRAKDGVKLEMVLATTVNAVRQKVQAIIKQDLAQIGIDVQLEQIDAGIFFDSAAGNDQNINHMYVDTNMYTNNSTSAIPIAYMHDWYAGPDGENIAQKSNSWTGGNRQRWVNADYDAAFEALQAATTMDEASELLITMNDLIIEDRAVVPMVNRAADAYAISKTLHEENVALGAGLEYNYWNIANWNRRAE